MMEQPHRILDISNGMTSLSLLKISRELREMAPGEILEIRGCDGETRSDLFQVISPRADIVIEETAETPCRVRLKKIHATTQHPQQKG